MRTAMISALIGLVALTGCATLVKGTTQIVSVSTPGVTGATCTLTNRANSARTLVTPAKIVLEKSAENVAVTCTKECYQDAVGVIASGAEVMTAGNVLVGGVVGLGIDAATGAMNKYTEDNQFTMVPIQGCRTKAGEKVSVSPSSWRSPKTA
jgi:hypothetical protein